jgi:hypothetical protein
VRSGGVIRDAPGRAVSRLPDHPAPLLGLLDAPRRVRGVGRVTSDRGGRGGRPFQGMRRPPRTVGRSGPHLRAVHTLRRRSGRTSAEPARDAHTLLPRRGTTPAEPARDAHTPAQVGQDSSRTCARRTQYGAGRGTPAEPACGAHTWARAMTALGRWTRGAQVAPRGVRTTRGADMCATRRFARSRTSPRQECVRDAQVRPESYPTGRSVCATRRSWAPGRCRTRARGRS